jgi:hypothetical protein
MASMAQGLLDQVRKSEQNKERQDAEAASMDSVCIEVLDWSTDGGQAIGFFEPAGELAIAHCWLFGESGRSFCSFYFDHGELYFANSINYIYNRPYYYDETVRKENCDTEVFDQAKTRTVSTNYFFEKDLPLCSGPINGAPKNDDLFVQADTSMLSEAISLRTMLRKAHRGKAMDCQDVNWRTEIMDAPQRCEMTSPDTALANVGIEDPTSSIATLGKIPSTDLVEDNMEFPHVDLTSSDGSQHLTFFFYYGDGSDNYAAMRLSRSRPATVRDTLPDKTFHSGKGVVLGMSKADVIAKLGECYSVYHSNQGHDLLSYSIKDLAHSEFLHRYNMPSYYACLEFEQDKLIDYRLGFDYP